MSFVASTDVDEFIAVAKCRLVDVEQMSKTATSPKCRSKIWRLDGMKNAVGVVDRSKLEQTAADQRRI
jgi:hypothetical protein